MLDAIHSQIQSIDGVVSSHYADITLQSAFQPIISLAHHRTVGYEALIRGSRPAGESVFPPDIFSLAKTELDTVYLDRLCRALHVSSFQCAGNESGWLFLNVNPDVVVHGIKYGTFFKELLTALNMPPERVVIEILESALLDERQLDAAVAFYRDLGCLIAIDDFGAGHSNFQRIWRLKPHIVKLDRSIICNAANDAIARRMLPSIVGTLHEAGSLVLVEGVETEQEAMIAMETSADLVQGYYFGRPASVLSAIDGASDVVSALFSQYRESMELARGRIKYPEHVVAIKQAVVCLNSVADTRSESLDCLKALLALPGAESCYVLDENGIQVGETYAIDHKGQQASNLFKPLERSQGAVWIRRPYWQRAMSQQGEIQCTRPYLSVATGRLCVTLSVAYQSPLGVRLLCFDLDCDVLENCGNKLK